MIFSKQQHYVALGLFLLTFAIYFLLSPGRIDSTDSQVRFDATHGVLLTGLPIINNPLLERTLGVGKLTAEGNPLASHYPAPSHLLYAPFLKLITLFSDNNREVEQFWFSHINQIFSAFIVVLLFYFYLYLGYVTNDALKWTLLFAFCTQFFVTATTSFHQILITFFLLLSVFSAFIASVKNSLYYCLLAAITFGIFIGFKSAYLIFLPGVLLVLSHKFIQQKNFKSLIIQLFLFLFIIFLFKNAWQFYSSLYSFLPVTYTLGLSAPIASSPIPEASIFDHKITRTLTGILMVLFSPGKGLLFFSPLLLIGFLNWQALLKEHTIFAAGIGILVFTWLAAMGSLESPAGDWCWGNRYIVPIAPLLFLFLPKTFNALFKEKPKLGKSLIIIGLCVQLLGLSLDYYRFFLNHSLPQQFFTSRMFYFQNSQLIERPLELIDSVNKLKYVNFNPPYRPGPLPESTTYAAYGISYSDPAINQRFLLEFPLLWLPRPWPLWVPFIDTVNKPVNVLIFTPIGLIIMLGGMLLIYTSRDKKPIIPIEN